MAYGTPERQRGGANTFTAETETRRKTRKRRLSWHGYHQRLGVKLARAVVVTGPQVRHAAGPREFHRDLLRFLARIEDAQPQPVLQADYAVQGDC